MRALKAICTFTVAQAPSVTLRVPPSSRRKAFFYIEISLVGDCGGSKPPPYDISIMFVRILENPSPSAYGCHLSRGERLTKFVHRGGLDVLVEHFY